MISLPNSISLAHIPTPLELYDGLAVAGGPRIWIKRDDLTGSGLSGNKVRKLEFVVDHARKNGADTLITCGGLQSNHCRATTLVGAKLGLKVHLVLRSEGNTDVDGNLLIDHLAGATVDVIPAAEYQNNLETLLQSRADEYARAGHKAHIIPTGASDEIGIWGYVKCAQELASDFQHHGIDPEYIVCATGSGGTQAGLTLGCYLQDLKTQVLGYAVCDSSKYFNDKVLSDITECRKRYNLSFNTDNISIKTNDHYIGPGYAKGYPQLYQCIKDVASKSGLLLDPVYTGKAFHGLLSDIKKGVYASAKDVVFVHTGGTFGLFAQKQAFAF